MSSPTPGPWVIPSKSHVGTRRCGVWSDDGRFQIAVCNSEALSWEANKANARLIAAAPDLLDAARAALDDLISDGHAHYRVAETLRAAIAKATGDSGHA